MPGPQPAASGPGADPRHDWIWSLLQRAGLVEQLPTPGPSPIVAPSPRRAPPLGGHFVSGPAAPPAGSRISEAFGGIPPMDPYAEADLRQRQAEFARIKGEIDERNSLFAIPALAPVAAVLGLEGFGAVVGDLAKPLLHYEPFQFPKRGPPPQLRGDNVHAQIGRRADADFKVRAAAKPGWEPQLTIKNENGVFRPDLSAPARDPLHPETRFQLELKPNTPSGRRAAARAVKRYFEGTGNRTRAIYYNPEDYE